MAVMEYENEPVRGLPGYLPKGEHIIWQGSPDWRTFARTALHTHWIAVYFAAFTALALISGNFGGALLTALSGMLAIALLNLFAWAVARTTVYTITNRRLVLRVGVALNKCINLPLALIGSASLRSHGGRGGDIALVLNGAHRLGYGVLWPHARPWRLRSPQPMMRALPDADAVAATLRQACASVTPNIVEEAGARRGPVSTLPPTGAAA